MPDYSEQQRTEMARQGHALKDGSYPIDTCEDAANARQAYGRAPESHRPELVRHINTREQELGCGREPFTPGD